MEFLAIVIGVGIVFACFGFVSWVGERVRLWEKRADKKAKLTQPTLSEILVAIADTPITIDHLRIRVRWPEKYWTRS